MSGIDKIKNKVEDVVGEAKEKIGDLTGNDSLKAEGKKDQASSGIKDLGEKAKDALT